MKNQASRSFAVLTLLTLVWAVPLVYAQSSSRMTANIPFNFTVGSQPLPAGQYSVKPLSQAAVLVQGEDSRSAAIVLTMAAQSSKTQQVGKLVFNRYGDQYFLAQIWTPATNTGRVLPKSRLEREIAKNVPNPEKTILTAEKR
jgi:hypothetical protein